MAVDGQSDYLIFNGSSFSSPEPASPGLKQTLNSVSCVTKKFCVAVDSNGEELTYTGSGWKKLNQIETSKQSTANYMVQVSCGSATSCLAVDDAGNAVVYSGSKWGGPHSVDKIYPTGISCYAPESCVLIDGGGYAVSYNSGSWSSPTLIDPLGHLNSISCDSSGNCLASDQSNNIFVGTSASGSNWTKISVSDLNISDVSCVVSSVPLECAIVGYGGSYFYSKSQLSKFISMDSISNSFTAVSCSTRTFCMGVGASGLYSIYNGSTMPTVGYIGLREHGVYITSVSCPSVQFCMAVDKNGNAIIYSGKWQDPKTIDTNGFLNSVSCTSSSFCIAVDGSGNALEYKGAVSGWQQPTPVDKAYGGLNSVSCTSSSFCMAVDDSGHYMVFNGSKWSNPSQYATGNGFYYVSCFVTNSCEAVSQSGPYWLIGGTGPNPSYNVQSGLNVPAQGSTTVRGISCYSSGFCQFASSFFSNISTVVPKLPIGISCPTASFCLEVTESGAVYTIVNGVKSSASVPG